MVIIWMIIITRIEPPIARIQLNSPHKLNALNLEMGILIKNTLENIETNTDIKVVILESLVEKAFSSGIDLKEFYANDTIEYREEFLSTWNSVYQFSKPIIVSLHGYTFGGGLELALMGDILIAANNTVFSQPELKVGTIPGLGATQRLPRQIGQYKANLMVLTGCKIDAETAFNWGLVSEVVPFKTLYSSATETAQLIATKSLPMLVSAKAALRQADKLPLEQGLLYEKQLFLDTFSLRDQKEGFQAFLQKRPTIFKGD